MIRFCKGIEADLAEQESVTGSENLFRDAHRLFAGKGMSYLPVREREGRYLFACYDDSSAQNIQSHIWNLSNSEKGMAYLKSFTEVTIVSCNEIGYDLARIWGRIGVKVYVIGEVWDIVSPEREQVNTVVGHGIYCEGNFGLRLKELAYWSKQFIFREYAFIENYYMSKPTLNSPSDDAAGFLLHNLAQPRLSPLEGRRFYNKAQLETKEANSLITRKIMDGEPCMIARIGNTEGWIMQEYLNGSYSRFWQKWLYTTMGFFSREKYTLEDVDRFAEMMIAAVKKCDIHCCQFDIEINILNQFADDQSAYVCWDDCCSGFYDNPHFWMRALAGKRVLVISSLSETIAFQYGNRDKIFMGDYRLPDMELIFYEALQTQVDNKCGYDDWFQAYQQMAEDIAGLDFDIAIIAAGAYAYPLAAMIKDMGRQAIDIASGIYPLFGIKMKRYDICRAINYMYNDAWIFPLEKPHPGAEKIEKGCYWE